jgi:F-type H+-transporting ATPase subunit b
MEFFKQNIIPGEVFVQLIAFLIVFFALKAAAWKPILKALESRREKIRTGLEDIEISKKEVESLKTTYQNQQARIEEEARAKLQDAVDEGRKVAKELQEKARLDARAVLDKAKEDIQLEAEKAKISLRNEIADLTVSATERLIQKKMDEKKDRDLVLDFIKEVEKLK